MAGRGGYQPPANPAPVSGPGALSQRTDGQQPMMDLPNAKYGENKEFQAIQAGAPVPQAPPASGAASPAAGPAAGPAPMPLAGGSLLPDQPVTHGADAGPGADSSSLQLANPVQEQHESALSLVQSLAANPNASPSVKFLLSALSRSF